MASGKFAFLATTAIRKPRSWQCRLQHNSCVFRASYSPRLSPNAPDLVQWIRDEGGFVHEGLKLENESFTGLGLVSSTPISAGTEIISLPRHIPLSLPLVGAPFDQTDSLLSYISAYLPEELWALRLSLKLLRERVKVGSFWWPYISNLPETFNLPIFFSKEEVQSLQYIPLIHKVNKRCKHLLFYEQHVNTEVKGVEPEKHPFGGQHVDAAALGWAVSAASTRAFHLQVDVRSNGKRVSFPMLLPLIDMCNHNFHPNARIVQETDYGCDKAFVKVCL